MSWKDKLRTPSFRGIRFNLFGTDYGGGRRNTTHTFLDRDKPYTQDTGRVPRTYSFDAFVSGFDYFRQRDRLIEALEATGPGTLIHPYYGEKNVNVVSFRVIESAADGNMVRFSLEFIEAGVLMYPSVSASRSSFLSSLEESITNNATLQFLNAYSITGYPQYIIDEAQARITELADLVDASTSFITASADDISDLAASVTDLRNDIDSLINTPTLLAARMGNSISLLSDSVFSRRESFSSYKEMLDYGGSTPTVTELTASRVQQNKNNTAYKNFVGALSVFYATKAAVEISYKSEEEANAAAQFLFDAIDTLSETVDDTVYNDLASLRALVSLNIPPEDENLPRVFEFSSAQTMPAIVLSYRLFADTDSEADIIARNAVENPNFVPGGETLKALSRV